MTGQPVEVVVRPLRPADLPALLRMEVELFEAAAWSPESLAAEIVGPGRWYVGATVGGELVGYAGLWFDGFDAQVMTIGTDERFQGRGLGVVLLHHLLDAGHARGIRRFRAYVLGDNTRMLDLIARFTDIRERSLDAGVASILFERRAVDD